LTFDAQGSYTGGEVSMSDSAQGMPQCPRGSGEHGIGWVELLANDNEASGRFYASVFGWRIQSFMPGYQVFDAPNGGPAGGLRGNAPEGSPGCTPYIHVTDVAAAQARIEAAGGKKLTEPERIAGGWIGHFADPNGTIYGLSDLPVDLPHQPAPFAGAPRPGLHTICSLEMYGGADLEATGRFFAEVFGWATQAAMPRYMLFDPGVSLGGVFQAHTPGTRALAYLHVEDVAAKLGEIEAAGGKRLGDPMSMPGVATFGYFSDPSGTAVGLIGP
jgi:predicted enzyme related to lactoylglutathione lyase